MSNVYTAPSKYHGVGGFASRYLKAGTVITPAEEGFPKAGLNTSSIDEINLAPHYSSQGFYFTTQRDIEPDEELLSYYTLPHECTPEECPEDYLPVRTALRLNRSL